MKARSSRRTVDAPHVERAYRDLKAGIVEGTIPPGRVAVRSQPRERARHEPHPDPRGARAPLAGGLSRSRRRPRLFRRRGSPCSRSTTPSTCGACSKGRRRRAPPSSRRRKTSSGCATWRAVPIGASQDYRQSETANVQFHLAIAACARNGLALELIERCLAQVDRFMSLGVSFGQFTENATEAHLQIVGRDRAPRPRRARARGWKRTSIAAAG